MKHISLKLKKSIIIGTTAAMMLSFIPVKPNSQSWFITGLFELEESSNDSDITIIKDDEEDIDSEWCRKEEWQYSGIDQSLYRRCSERRK